MPPEALLFVAPRLLLVICRHIGDVIQQWRHEQPFRAILPRHQDTRRLQALDCSAVFRALSMTVDCLQCRYCDGRVGEVEQLELLRFGVPCRGCRFIYNLEQILRVRAEVFQVSRYYCDHPVQGKYNISRLHCRKLWNNVRSLLLLTCGLFI